MVRTADNQGFCDTIVLIFNSLQLTEIALFKQVKQLSISRISAVTQTKTTGRMLVKYFFQFVWFDFSKS